VPTQRPNVVVQRLGSRWLAAFGGLCSAVGRVVFPARGSLGQRYQRRGVGVLGYSAAVVIVGLLASGAAFILGFIGWFQAADMACHGGYECPF
jgi:hypothetical protein